MKKVKFPLEYQIGTNLIKYPDDISLFSNADIINGDTIHAEYSGILELDLQEPEIVTLELTNIAIANAQLVGDIYWVQENTQITVTGDVGLPDGEYMLMAERVVDATKVVDDARFKATVSSGAMTMNATFKTTGNYLFSSERLNRGLDRIGAGVNLSFDDIEFDVFI